MAKTSYASYPYHPNLGLLETHYWLANQLAEYARNRCEVALQLKRERAPIESYGQYLQGQIETLTKIRSEARDRKDAIDAHDASKRVVGELDSAINSVTIRIDRLEKLFESIAKDQPSPDWETESGRARMYLEDARKERDKRKLERDRHAEYLEAEYGG